MTMLRNAGGGTHALINFEWWSLALSPYQSKPVFNALVRPKYRYGLPLIEATEELKKKTQGGCTWYRRPYCAQGLN